MTRYFLDIANGSGPVPDEEGQEFATEHDAITEAGRAVCAIVCDDIREGNEAVTATIQVLDEARRPVARVELEARVVR